MSSQHCSMPNGRSVEHATSKAAESKELLVEHYQHSAIVPNSRVVTVVRDKTTGNHAMYVGNDKQWAAQVIDAGVLEGVLGPSPFMLQNTAVRLSPRTRFPDTLAACMSLDMDAVKSDTATTQAKADEVATAKQGAVCAVDTSREVAAAPVIVTIVQDTRTDDQAMYVGDKLRCIAKPVAATQVSATMGDAVVVLRVVLTTLRYMQPFPNRLQDCQTRPAVSNTCNATAVAAAKPTSREWAAAFVEKYKRFPHAIDYADAGYGTGSQCECATVGECVLRDACNGHSCDRNCYAQQLKDYIALSSTKRAATKVEELRPTTVEALLATIRTMMLPGNCKVIRIPLWAERLLLQGVQTEEMRRVLRWKAGSWRPQSIYGLQCIWETEELVVE